MKDDEKQFLIDIYNYCRPPRQHRFESGVYPRDLINKPDFYIPYKRAWYILEKWANKGWYDYGVTVDLGWLTPKGIETIALLTTSELKF